MPSSCPNPNCAKLLADNVLGCPYCGSRLLSGASGSAEDEASWLTRVAIVLSVCIGFVTDWGGPVAFKIVDVLETETKNDVGALASVGSLLVLTCGILFAFVWLSRVVWPDVTRASALTIGTIGFVVVGFIDSNLESPLAYPLIPLCAGCLTCLAAGRLRGFAVDLLNQTGTSLRARFYALTLFLSAPLVGLLVIWVISNSITPVRRHHVPPTPSPTPIRISPTKIESEVNEALMRSGFQIAVRATVGGTVYLGGEVSSLDEERTAVNVARRVRGVRRVESRLKVPKGWMGVAVRDEPRGVVVTYVATGSPAATAGIMENDVLTALDGRRILAKPEFDEQLRDMVVGQVVRVTRRNDFGSSEVEVRLAKAPPR